MQLISVIVPVYKVEPYLDECVQSLVNQTYRNLEIILVDDGSPDNCPAMCDNWAKKDKRIKVIHKENGGLSSARNAGLDSASGDYVGFVDSDDFIESDMYEKLLDAFSSSPNRGVASCLLFKDVEGKSYRYLDKWHIDVPREISYKDFGELLLTAKVNFVLCSKLYRRELVEQVRFTVGRVNEDSLYLFDLSQKIKELKLAMLEIPYYGYHYRMRSGSICRDENRPLIPAVIRNYQEMEAKTKNSDPKLSESLRYHWQPLLLSYYENLLMDSSESELARRYEEEVRTISLVDIWKNEELSKHDRFKYSFLCIDNHLFVILKKLRGIMG